MCAGRRRGRPAERPRARAPRNSTRTAARPARRSPAAARTTRRDSSERQPPGAAASRNTAYAGQQQNHRQVVAERRARRPRGTRHSRRKVGSLTTGAADSSVRATSSDVQGIDLGDDRLAPEGVRAGEQQRGGDSRPAAIRVNSTATSTIRPHASAACTAESRFIAYAWFDEDGAPQAARWRKYSGYASRGVIFDRAAHRLERCGVAEVEAGQERRAIQEERAERHDERRRVRPHGYRPRFARRRTRGARARGAC